MTRTEQRRTRESLTRTLERIAARITDFPTHTVEWNDRHLHSRRSATVSAMRLWVAGSYARGAVECGDLDLILNVAIDGPYPPSSAIKSALLGRVQDTSLYIGTPEKNSSNIAFPEARLVWDREEPDWRAHLAAIAADPDAARYRRPTDQLPLRPDQLSVDFEQLELLLALREQRVLAWEYVDESEIAVDPSAVEHAGLQRIRVGAKTHDALQLAVSYLGWRTAKPSGWGRLPSDRLSAGLSDKTCFWFDGTLVVTGMPQLPLDRLDAPFCNRLALVPHRSRRGPNGIWIITRGPEHPLEKALANSRVFYVTCDGATSYYVECSTGSYKSAAGIDLHLDAEDAEAEAEELRDMVGDENEIGVREAAGAEVLALIAGCDLVGGAYVSVPLSDIGQYILSGHHDLSVNLSDASALVDALRPQDE